MAHIEISGSAPERRQLDSDAKVTFRCLEDRRRFYERSRSKSEAVYREHPHDVANVNSLAEALLELAHYEEYLIDRVTLIQDAISMLEGALAISPSSHQTVWRLGGSYTSAAFLTPDHNAANTLFENASHCFQRAVDLDPNNSRYTRSLKACTMAPSVRAKWLGENISDSASVGVHLKAPFVCASWLGKIICDSASVGVHLKVPEQQAEIQSGMGSNQHISSGHVKVPEQQTEIQRVMGSNQHISTRHVKNMLENLAVTDI